MTYEQSEIESDLNLVQKEFDVKIDEPLLHKYRCGVHPHLIAYEKVDNSYPDIPILQKYLIGAASSLIQPTTYYDVFRACRSVNFIRVLANSIKMGVQKAENWDSKKKLLKTAVKFDDFDSTLFEVTTASAYLANPETANLIFPQEKSEVVPDLIVKTQSKEILVECKKFNRQTNFTADLRDDARDLLGALIERLIPNNKSSLGEITFRTDPKSLDLSHLYNDYLRCLEAGVDIEREGYSLSVCQPKKDVPDYKLVNSPKYYSEKYGYDEKKWIGIVTKFLGKPLFTPDYDDKESGYFSWFDEIKFEIAIKWNVDAAHLERRLKKINYSTVFKSLRQIEKSPLDSQIHFWIERDSAVGHRKTELENLLRKIGEGNYKFGWIIFNETISRVMLNGRFDFIEHAHPANHKDMINPPHVTNVFIKNSDIVGSSGKFGIGMDMF